MNIVRVWFSKGKEASYISHLDMQRVMHRVLRKGKVNAWYSKGFNPHIYLTFALPLPLGQESVCEYMDYKTEDEDPDLNDIFYKIKDILPQGIEVYNVTLAKHKANDIEQSRYLITFPNEIREKAEKAVSHYNNAETAITYKLGKQKGQKVMKELDLKQYIDVLTPLNDNSTYCLDLLLPAGVVTINPALILNYFQEQLSLDCTNVSIKRTQVLMKNMEIFE